MVSGMPVSNKVSHNTSHGIYSSTTAFFLWPSAIGH